MGKKTIWIVVIISLLIIFSSYFYYSQTRVNGNTIKNTKSTAQPVTEENLPAYLSLSPLVQDLPSDAVLELKTSAKTYTVKKGSVTVNSPSNPDITLSIPSSYISQLSNGFCSTLSNARSKGDLGAEIHISKVSATWKYHSMYKYKDCLGF